MTRFADLINERSRQRPTRTTAAPMADLSNPQTGELDLRLLAWHGLTHHRKDPTMTATPTDLPAGCLDCGGRIGTHADVDGDWWVWWCLTCPAWEATAATVDQAQAAAEFVDRERGNGQQSRDTERVIRAAADRISPPN